MTASHPLWPEDHIHNYCMHSFVTSYNDVPSRPIVMDVKSSQEDQNHLRLTQFNTRVNGDRLTFRESIWRSINILQFFSFPGLRHTIETDVAPC